MGRFETGSKCQYMKGGYIMRKKDKADKTNKVVGFNVTENECIWMKAGVISFRICDNAYDCNTCPFDKAMQKAMKSGDKQKEPWSEKLKIKYNGEKRPCRHVLTGRIEPPKLCASNYECSYCDFDQWLDETDVSIINRPDFKEAHGYQVAENYYYHMGHGWARVEHGGYIRVGFDDFAVKLFGKAHSVDLPKIGAKLSQNQPGWAFGRNALKAEMMSPVSGTVLALNHKVLDYPEIVHENPYEDGWLFLVGSKNLKINLQKLYFGEETFYWMEEECRKLMRLIGPEYEKLSATGGLPIDDLYGHHPEIGWDTLVHSFLRT
jgi:glycine cleavage system H lipoate-binding protein